MPDASHTQTWKKPRRAAATKFKTEPSTNNDTSHIRMAAWLAVAAVAVSSGAISYSASAAPAKTQVKTDPMSAISRQLNVLQQQGGRIEAGVNRLERLVNDWKNSQLPQGGDMPQSGDVPQGGDNAQPQGDMPKPPMGERQNGDMGKPPTMNGKEITQEEKEALLKKHQEQEAATKLRLQQEEAARKEKEAAAAGANDGAVR